MLHELPFHCSVRVCPWPSLSCQTPTLQQFVAEVQVTLKSWLAANTCPLPYVFGESTIDQPELDVEVVWPADPKGVGAKPAPGAPENARTVKKVLIEKSA